MLRKKLKEDERDRDVELALRLHEKFNPLGVTENAVFPDHEQYGKYEPRTLIDQTLEIIDPTPNIYTLFGQFDARFFANKLVSVEVKWSSRMTSCAGVCTFHPRNRDCVISLSAPLLKLRPRKDLVETLLHEMIHGYLFLTNNNRDRDGHGPEFCKIMNKINQEAGTHITIYHSFHEEVKVYQQHWWRCDGPCQKWPPYFGMVRRAMNRAPGPSDFWWSGHQQKCNGRFVKVREPEKKVNPGKVRPGGNENKKPAEKSGRPDKKLDDWCKRSGGMPVGKGIPSVQSTGSKVSGSFDPRQPKTDEPSAGGLVKLGTSTNNVHGWGTGGPGASSTALSGSTNLTKSSNDRPAGTLKFSGQLGGSGAGRSNLLDKYSAPSYTDRNSKQRITPVPTIDESPPSKKPKIVDLSNCAGASSLGGHADRNREFYDCPVCNLSIRANRLNDHLDECLARESTPSNAKPSVGVIPASPCPSARKPTLTTSTPLSRPTNPVPAVGSTTNEADKFCMCPNCDLVVAVVGLYEHLDRCSPSLRYNRMNSRQSDAPSKPRTSAKNMNDRVTTNLNESYVCLVCNVNINGDIALNDHLEECVRAIFNDDTFDVGDDSIVEVSSPKTSVVDVKTSAKFPCPVCMRLIQDSLMNEHLDRCLAGQK